MTQHKQTRLTLRSGKKIYVDEKIQDLIAVMNTRSVKTHYSCQGIRPQINIEEDAYVQFSGKRAKTFIRLLVSALLKHQMKVWILETAWRNRFVFRWDSRTYPQILALVSRIQGV